MAYLRFLGIREPDKRAHMKQQVLPALLLTGGAAMIGMVLVFTLSAKFAVVFSAFGLLAILSGANLIGGRETIGVNSSKTWLLYVPLVLTAFVDLTTLLFPLMLTVIVLAFALTALFVLCATTDISGNLFLFILIFVAGSISLNVYYYYPLDTGIDSWAYLAVSSAINQSGHYTGIQQPTPDYYFPFPVMSVVASVVSQVSGLSLPLSMYVFAGGMILAQPFLIYLLTKRIFSDKIAANMSALLVVMEAAVTQWINAPIAQSAALSLLLLVLLLIYDLTPIKQVVVFLLFFVIAAMHGAVALVGIILLSFLSFVDKKRGLQLLLLSLVSIFLVYLLVAGALRAIVMALYGDFTHLLLTLLGKLPVAPSSSLFPIGSSGLIFIWWGLPAALGIFSLIFIRKRPHVIWSFAGLGLLGISFAVNVVAPGLTFDRYGGLAAWLLLAASGGVSLRSITRSSRVLILLLPIVFLVSLSAIVSPTLSPQFGFAQPGLLPTTVPDRIALDWLNVHGAPNTKLLVGDHYAMAYLSFQSYQSGFIHGRSIQVPDSYSVRGLGSVLLVRWQNNNNASRENPCTNLTADESQYTVSFVYNNSCDMIVIGP